MRPLAHILEPTARSVYGHHLHYVESIAGGLDGLGIPSICYLAAEAANEPLVLATGILKRFAFTFRYSVSFEQVYGAHVTVADPVGRVLMDTAKRAIGEVPLDHSRVASENIRYRLRADLDRLSASYGLTEAEAQTVALARQDVLDFADFLRSQAADRTNVVVLPTAEFFLLDALLAQVAELAPQIAALHLRMWNFMSLERNSFDLFGLANQVSDAYAAHGVKVFVYSEVPWGIAKLAEIASAQAGYLDINSFSAIPRFVWGSQRALPDPHRPTTRLFFPGSYRRFPDKGLEVLHDAIALASGRPDVTLVFQEPDWEAVGADREAVAGQSNIVVLPAILDRARYEAEFLRADYVCLPYDGVTWLDPFRGSGVILEGILFEKPVIIKSGTTLDQYAQLFSLISIDDAAHLFARVGDASVREDDVAAAKTNRSRYAALLQRNDFLQAMAALQLRERDQSVAAEPATSTGSGR